MTRHEFDAAYAARARVSVETLRALGKRSAPCACGEPDCPGWQMVPVGELVWARTHGVASAADERVLAWIEAHEGAL